MKYRQCLLKKKNTTQTSWIPEKFASKGKFLRIKEDNGWEVMRVSEIAVEEEVVSERSRDFKKTRQASDI